MGSPNKPDPYCRFKSDPWLFCALAFRVACFTAAVMFCVAYLGVAAGPLVASLAFAAGRL